MAEQKKTSNTQKKTSQTTQRKNTSSNSKKQQTNTKKTAVQESRVRDKIRFDQYLINSTPLFFGLYMAVASGLLGIGKYYMQSTLANEIFTSNSRDLVAHWIALSDIGFLAGLAGLVVLPAVSYYQRHGLRRLGIAFVIAFVFVLVATGALWYYIESLPEPQPTPQFPQGLQQ